MSPLLTYIHNNFNRQPRTMPVIICQSPSKTALIDTYEMPASIQLHLHPFKCLNSSSLLHLAVHGPKISNWNVNFYQDDEWFYPDTFPLLALNHISQQCSISHITVLLLSQIPLIDMVADSREKKKKKTPLMTVKRSCNEDYDHCISHRMLLSRRQAFVMVALVD